MLSLGSPLKGDLTDCFTWPHVPKLTECMASTDQDLAKSYQGKDLAPDLNVQVIFIFFPNGISYYCDREK